MSKKFCAMTVCLAIAVLLGLISRSTAVFNGHRVRSETMEKGFVLLQKHDGKICGGVLITWKHVLTTATCVEKDNVEYAFVGARKRDEYLHKMEVESIDLHDDYDDATGLNNLAVVSLKNPSRRMMMASGIYPVPVLWRGSNLRERQKVYAIGFGKTSARKDAEYASSLRNATLYKYDLDRCQGPYHVSQSEREALCLDGSESTVCKGDAGGPVMVWTKGRDEEFKPHVVGILCGVWQDSSSCVPGNKVVATVLEGSYDYIARAVGKYRRF